MPGGQEPRPRRSSMPWIWRPLQATVSSVAPWSSPTSAPAVVNLAALLNPGAQGEGVLITCCWSPPHNPVDRLSFSTVSRHVRRERIDGWCEDIQPIALVDLVVTCVRFKWL
uniref:Uncharacterized protein n=1 Tax=Oryza nivara TaxID=4536 RepID=A0A0E0II05_ORYNI